MSHKDGKALVLEDSKVLATLSKSWVRPKVKIAAHFARGVCLLGCLRLKNPWHLTPSLPYIFMLPVCSFKAL